MRAPQARWARVVPGLGLGVAAWLAIGPPDVASAATFFGGPWPTDEAALGALGVLGWALVLTLLGLELGAAWRARPRETGAPRWRRSVAVFILGAAVFGTGWARHGTDLKPMCCGSVERASDFAH